MAVLPFRNLTQRGDVGHFAEALALDVEDALSGGTDARIVPAATISAYRVGDEFDFKRLASDIGLRYALQGVVREKTTGIVIASQIASANSLDILWSQRFTCPSDLSAEAQETLSETLIAHVRSQTHLLETQRARQTPRNLTARDAVMRALASHRKMTAEAFMDGLHQAELALSIEPDYALAKALCANVKAVIYNQTIADTPQMARAIREEAEAAVRQEPDNATVLSTAANALTFVGYLEDGLDLALRSMRLDPNNVYAYLPAGAAASMLGRNDEAIDYLTRGVAISPDEISTWVNYLWQVSAHARAGRWDDADAAADACLDLAPDNAAPNISKALIAMHIQKHELAAKHIAAARRHEPETPLAIWELRYGRAYEGHPVWDDFVSHLRSLWQETDASHEARFSKASGERP